MMNKLVKALNKEAERTRRMWWNGCQCGREAKANGFEEAADIVKLIGKEQ